MNVEMFSLTKGKICNYKAKFRAVAFATNLIKS